MRYLKEWTPSQWKQRSPTAGHLKWCKACDPSMVALTEEDARDSLEELEHLLCHQRYVQIFQRQYLALHQLKCDDPAKFEQARLGMAKLPSSDELYDAGNFTYTVVANILARVSWR